MPQDSWTESPLRIRAVEVDFLVNSTWLLTTPTKGNDIEGRAGALFL
ncbi:MAG: hypothetical protein KF824_11625 [Fimbriimonadaceae bacterium]|nr:MAG: hypothetical protein KF824_11625 [Fimbriimonadaceae bacterium]